MNFFREYKKQILILVAIVIAITAFVFVGKNSKSPLVNNVVGVVITPLQKLTSNTLGWFDDRISSLRDETEIFNENNELKAKIELLERDNKRLSLYEEENKKLSALLEIAQKFPEYTTTGANVIGKDPGNWYNIFLIDKGTKDGLAVNMVVIDEGGVIGKITEANYNYSKVQSILDNKSSVSAMSLRTGDLGVVKGDYTLLNDGLCKMEFINGDSSILKGDEIITSQLSDIYPPGLTLGNVKEVITDTNGLTKYAIIEPPGDLKHVTTILVITDFTPTDTNSSDGE